MKPKGLRLIVTKIEQLVNRFVLDETTSNVYDLKRPGILMSLTSFKYSLAGQCIKAEVQGDDGNVETKKLDAFKLWLKHQERKTVAGERFRPGDDSLIRLNGVDYVNSWRQPWSTEYKKEYIAFYALMAHVFPDADEREYVMQWFGDIYQNPGRKPSVALVSTTPQTGTGRGLVSEIHSRALGSYFVQAESMQHLIGGQFNGWRYKTLLASLPEVDQGTFHDRLNISNELKTIISDPTVEINIKYRVPFVTETYTRLWIQSNEAAPIIIDDTDRRFMCTQGNLNKLPQKLADRIGRLLNVPDFIAYCAWRFEQVELEDGLLFRQPPDTPTRRQMIDMSRSHDVNEIIDRLKEWPRDVATYDELEGLITLNSEPKQKGQLAGALKVIKATQFRKYLNGKQTRIWAVRNGRKWRDARPEQVQDELNRNRPESDNVFPMVKNQN